jgi:hypothetical protein
MHLSISPEEAGSGILTNPEFNGIQRDVVTSRGVGNVVREYTQGAGETRFRMYGDVPSQAIQAVPVDSSVIDKLKEYLPSEIFERIKEYHLVRNLDSTFEINLNIFIDL